MIEADSVLSTPPLNSSSIQEASPPPEARAESLDSFSHQPAIRQPESRTLTSESVKPAEDNAGIITFPGRTKRAPRKRKSAIADVKKSGYELVPSRKLPKEKGKRLTDSELGKVPFEPWEKHPDDMTPIDGEHWHARGVDVRFAHAVMTMSKEGLIDLHATVDMDHVDALIANIFGTHEFLKFIAAMMESAINRILISGCAAADRGIMGDGKQPLNLEGFHRRPKLVVRGRP
jgi:hypothetical protein